MNIDTVSATIMVYGTVTSDPEFKTIGVVGKYSTPVKDPARVLGAVETMDLS
jgi:hypothetical protein